MGIYGQDWSGYQSATPSTSGIDFMFTKVTEGLSYVNPRWDTQYDHAKANGLVVGKYHYPHMGNDPHTEADYFIKNANIQPGDVIVLDWEGYDPSNQGVSHARMLSYRDSWLKYVKAKFPNNPVGMYCNTDYWLNIDTTQNCGDFLWIATAGKTAGNPGIKYNWTIHQYSTAGGIDHDFANFKDRAAMKAWVASFDKTNNNSGELVATTQEINAIAKATADLIISPAYRDKLAYANLYFLQEIFSFKAVPATNSNAAVVNALQTELKAVLGKLDPTVITDIQNAFHKVLAGTVVTGTVSGTVK